jgi:hypothetical protein
VEYKKEAFDMFEDLMKDLYGSVSRFTFRAQLAPAMEDAADGLLRLPGGHGGGADGGRGDVPAAPPRRSRPRHRLRAARRCWA